MDQVRMSREQRVAAIVIYLPEAVTVGTWLLNINGFTSSAHFLQGRGQCTFAGENP